MPVLRIVFFFNSLSRKCSLASSTSTSRPVEKKKKKKKKKTRPRLSSSSAMRAQGAVAGCCCLLLLLLLASTASGQSGASDRGQALPVGSLPSAVVSFLSHFFFLRGPFFPANKFNKEEKTNKHTNRSPAIMDRQTKSHRPRATSRRWGRSADRGASNLPPTSWSPGTQRYFLAPSLSLSLLSLSLSLSLSLFLSPPTLALSPRRLTRMTKKTTKTPTGLPHRDDAAVDVDQSQFLVVKALVARRRPGRLRPRRALRRRSRHSLRRPLLRSRLGRHGRRA